MNVKKQRPRPITMAMIAEKAGLARTTVSFILNDRYKERGISEKTAERVREIAEKNHFIPNETARSLSRRRTGMIGIFLPGFNSVWAEEVVRGIRTSLFAAEGYVPLIASQHDDADWEEREIKLLIERDVEAIICCPTVQTHNYKRIMDRGIPLVFIGHRAEDMSAASYVAWDGAKVAAAATRHLISKGRDKIAFLGRGINNPTSSDRYEGYRQAMLEAGLELRNEWHIDVPDYDDPSGIVQAIFSKPDRPNALISDLWLQALQALASLDSAELKIPEDVSVLALGDAPICEHPRISLSTVIEPAESIGRLAGDLTLSLINDPDQPAREILVPQNTIVDRGTT